jgi:hypothetical protein
MNHGRPSLDRERAIKVRDARFTLIKPSRAFDALTPTDEKHV